MKPRLSSRVCLTAVLLGAIAACQRGNAGASGSSSAASGGAADSTHASSGGGGGGHRREHGHKEHRDAADAGATPDAGVSPVQFAIQKPTPEPMAAPPLRKQPGLPALPNLPPRDQYPVEGRVPPASAPPAPPESGSCGEVWSGTEYMPVDCVSPAHEKHPTSAKVVVSYARMKPPVEELPRMVDHRFNGTEGPMRKQGGVDCTAFAFTSALDHAYARWTGAPAEFSVMQVWARYHKLSEASAAAANVGTLLAPEAEWPYDRAIAASWRRCNKDPSKQKGPCGQPVDDAKLAELDRHALAEITQIERIKTVETDLLREKLAAGQDATLGIKLLSFATAGEPGARYIIGRPPRPGEAGGKSHEMLIAGYAMTPNGTYYLVHNSWGTKWGDQGYAWLHEDVLKAGGIHGSMEIPDVLPLVAVGQRGAHERLVDKCEAGHAPDSISGLCAGLCPDGGPRHNNVCADAKKGECPSGHVNLTGECVLSAPTSTGTEGKVKWACAAGGCTYEVPRGELDCPAKECQVSCPAPDFRLATTPKGLVCVE